MKLVIAMFLILASTSVFAADGKAEVTQINSFSIIYISGAAAKEISKSINTPAITNAEVTNYKRGKSLSCQDLENGETVCTIVLKQNGKDGEVTDFVF